MLSFASLRHDLIGINRSHKAFIFFSYFYSRPFIIHFMSGTHETVKTKAFPGC